MPVKHQIHFAPHISFLLCSILVLKPHQTFFQNLNIKKNIKLEIFSKEETYILTALSNNSLEDELQTILNQSSIRQLAYKVIKPILIYKQETKTYNKELKPSKKDLSLLRKYLKKFRYFYKKFFLHQKNQNTKISSTDINTKAIQMLFLLVGV